jgi:MFS family permease
MGAGVAVPAIPALIKTFHVSLAVGSGVTTAFVLGNLAGALPAGWLIDRFGRRRVMLVGPFLTAVCAFLVVTAHTFGVLLTYRFLDGFAAQLWLMGRIAAISHGAAANQRGRQVSWMFGMDNTGKAFGPLIGGLLVTKLGLHAPFLAYGFLALTALVPAYFYSDDTPRRERTQPGAKRERPMSLRQLVVPRLPYFGVALCAGFARGPVQSSLLNLYAAYRYGLSPERIGVLAFVAASIMLPLGFLAGWLMDRFGRKRTMVPGFAGVTITMTGLALTAFMHVHVALYITIYLVGIAFQGLTGGSIQTVGADVAPPEARGRFLGIWRFTGQGGTSLSPLVFALLGSQFGYGASFLYIAASAAGVASLLIFLVPETGGAQVRSERAIERETTGPGPVAHEQAAAPERASS